MLKRDDFVEFILEGPKKEKAKKAASDQGPSLPEGFGDFGFSSEETQEETASEFSFARQLMEASGFGNAEYLERSEVILGNDPAARYLPQRVYYWPKKDKRPYQTLLFELEQPGRQLLKAPLFKKLKSQEILEDAVSRLVQMSLRGFEKGGEKRTASVKSGKQDETLCIVSIRDDRLESDKPLHLVCLGTKSKKLNSLENYHIREEARLWERQLAVDHLSRLYDRHFRKLDGEKWQESFITGEERKLAHKLMDACVKKQPRKRSIEKCVVNLLEEIAKTFGLRKKKGGSRLMPFELPKDHDIGVDPEKREKQGGQNLFEGMILRDEKSRLLGYIIYCLDQKKDADKLRKYLERHNRFHNVLVIYPDGTEAVLELWQGMKRLEGKLTKQGAAFEGEGKIVNLLSRFFVVSKAKVRNPEELAQELAYRARYLRRLALKQLQDERKSGLLRDLYNSFKEALIHDQTEDEFADSYAQTLTYGLLSARWISKDIFASRKERFTRKRALDYFPPTSPFLREFFSEVLKASFEFKLSWLLDDITDMLDRTDIGSVFGPDEVKSENLTSDPVIHFYEPFLASYDSKLKKSRGVYYTPHPVVSFIVRSVDEILRTEFGLADGLADTTSWSEMVKRVEKITLPENVNPEDPFVQILDPATGTGTFLMEVIEVVYKTMMTKWKKNGHNTKKTNILWNNYVTKFLLPRLHGYELMIAPYAIAHMKIGLKLYETGYRFGSDERAKVYLTNALEPSQDFSGTFAFAIPALAHEAEAVNEIKRNQCFTVVIGNPPYSRASSNKGEFAEEIILPYKDVVRDERNIQPLSDDYLKFIALSQNYLKKAGLGVHGMITNNTFLSGRITRGARQSLMKTFPLIRIVNLHGSGKVESLGSKGEDDENVFDILQGVAISLFSKSPSPAQVFYSELIGPRTVKYEKLVTKEGLQSAKLEPKKPYFLWIPRTGMSDEEYDRFTSLSELFRFTNVSGKPGDDSLLISFSADDVLPKLQAFQKELKGLNSPKLTEAGRKLAARAPEKPFITSKVCPYAYRPFDVRYTYYDPRIWTRAVESLRSCLDGSPILLTTKLVKDSYFAHAFVSRTFPDVIFLSNTSSVNCYSFPSSAQTEGGLFNNSSTSKHSSNICLNTFSRVISESVAIDQIFTYIYAVLYSPNYREKYYESLQYDFPRIPLTSDLDFFCTLSDLGHELVALHLMESPKLEKWNTEVVRLGDFQVEKVSYSDETVWIDKAKTRGFLGVSEDVWNFRIGSYQICEKWLKDRQAKGGKNPRSGRVLTEQDIAHYQKVIVAIKETIHLMDKIDKVIEKHGGWPDAFITKNGDN